MANKPERFSQDKIRREKISPEELESWVRYVKEEMYEALKKAGAQISKDDIRIIVHLLSLKIESDEEINAEISVQTVRPGGYSSFYVIALFASSSDGKETFENYAKFKNVYITERDVVFVARREVEVSV